MSESLRLSEEQATKLMAAAASTSFATTDLIEAVRLGQISIFDNVGSDEVLSQIVDGARLVLKVTQEIDGLDAETRLANGKLLGELTRWLDLCGTQEEPADHWSCRVCGCTCGCTDDRACEGGCSWVERDLCSACAPAQPSVKVD